MRTVRTAARAIILDQGSLLVACMRDKRGDWYLLPGGGQRHGENLHQTLIRECREEIGASVKPTTLAYIREYIGRNHDFSVQHKHFHQLEVVFLAQLADPAALDLNYRGNEHDKHQVGLKWMPLEEVQQVKFFPAFLKKHIQDGQILIDPPGYMGDIN